MDPAGCDPYFPGLGTAAFHTSGVDVVARGTSCGCAPPVADLVGKEPASGQQVLIRLVVLLERRQGGTEQSVGERAWGIGK